MTYLFLFLTTACTDYEVHSLRHEQPSNWFDEASDRYRDDGWGTDTGLDEDTGSSDERDATAPEDAPNAPSEGNGSDDGASEEGGTEESGPGHASDPDTSDTETDSPGTGGEDSWGGSPSARGPGPGEVIFTELMVYPRVTDDSVGEWVELRNVGSVWMDLAGYRLADRGVDGTEIVPVSAGSLLVAPGEYLIICAAADYWDNGGVECDGTFHYWTLGGGFALSNTEDEAQLRTPDGLLIDEVRYAEGFASEGDSLGLDPAVISSITNDNEDLWCDQRSFLSFGDSGTPGAQNDVCW